VGSIEVANQAGQKMAQMYSLESKGQVWTQK